MVKRFINNTGQELIVTTADGENITVPKNGIVVGKYYEQFSPPLTYYDNEGHGLDFSSGAPSRVIGGGSGSAFSTNDKVNPTATELQAALMGTDPRPNTRANALGNSTSFDVYNLDPSDPITGTSGAADAFTRSSGTWTTDSLVNQYAFTYQASDPTTGSWNRILDNDTDTITVEGNVFASADTLITSTWNPIGDFLSTGGASYNYTNMCSDGVNLWLSPYTSSDVLRMNPVTGTLTNYPHGVSSAHGASFAGAYDGQSMWFSPYTGEFIRVCLGSGTLTTFAHDKGDRAFSGIIFTGEYLYAAPHGSTHIARVNPNTAEITYFEHGAVNTNSGQAGYHYYAVAHHGDYLWFAPYAASSIMRFHIPTGNIQHIPHGAGDLAFSGVVATPDGIYFIPANADHILKIDPGTRHITRYTHNAPTEPAYNGGAYDGRRYIYMNEQFNSVLARFDTVTGNVVRYPLGKGNAAFFGCIYFDNQIFMAPYNHTEVLRVRLPQTGAGGLNVYGRLSAKSVELSLPTYATNAAAVNAGLSIGELYLDSNSFVKAVIEEL